MRVEVGEIEGGMMTLSWGMASEPDRDTSQIEIAAITQTAMIFFISDNRSTFQ